MVISAYEQHVAYGNQDDKMPNKTLEDLQKLAEAGGYRAWLSSAEVDRAAAVPELFCLYHVDDQGRDYIAHILFANQVSAAMGVPTTNDDIIFLQLTSVLPFPVTEAGEADTALLLHGLNRTIPHGVFGYSEEEGLVFFRAVLTHSSMDIDPNLAFEAINMTRFFVASYAPLIEPVASGSVARMDLYRALQEKGFRIPGVLGLEPQGDER